MISNNDTDLMLKFAKGDNSAFDKIMAKYKNLIMNIAYKYVHNVEKAEDVTQEIFIKIYNSAKSYKPTAKLSTWIYRITANYCLNEIRDNRIKTVELGDYLGTLSDPVDGLHEEKQKKLIKEAVDSLPDRQKMVVILSKYEDLSYQEISEVLGCSVSAVDSLLQRAKQTLKEKLKNIIE